MSIKQRVARLEAVAGNCDGAVLTLLTYYDGETKPPIPSGAIRCSVCGEVHALFLQLVTVPSGPEVMDVA